MLSLNFYDGIRVSIRSNVHGNSFCTSSIELLCTICVELYSICSEEIDKTKFNSMIGLDHRERVDEALYGDYESAKAREVRLLQCSCIFCEHSFDFDSNCLM